MSVLLINSSPRQAESNSRELGNYAAEVLGGTLVKRDLGSHPLPPISPQDQIGVHGSSTDNRESLHRELALSETLIGELKSADTLIIASPMHNFSVPHSLKRWIDAICRAGVTFRYTENGPKGLMDIERAIIITATGGTPLGSKMDFVSPYLEMISRFIGARNIHHIDASGSKRDRGAVISEGKAQIDALLGRA